MEPISHVTTAVKQLRQKFRPCMFVYIERLLKKLPFSVRLLDPISWLHELFVLTVAE